MRDTDADARRELESLGKAGNRRAATLIERFAAS